MPRFGIAAKLATAFGGLLALFVLSGVLFSFATQAIRQDLATITTVAQQISAAAYEMEINAIGTGLGVAKYIHDPRLAYRKRFENDRADFRESLSYYRVLASTEEDLALAQAVGVLYEEYSRLGLLLMNTRDAQTDVLDRLVKVAVSIDTTVNDPRVFQDAAATPGGREKQWITNSLRTEIADTFVWLAHTAWSADSSVSRQHIADEIEQSHKRLLELSQQDLTAAEIIWLKELVGLMETAKALVESLLGNRAKIRKGLNRFIEMRNEMDDLLDEKVQISAERRLIAANEDALDKVRALRRTLTALGLVAGLAALLATIYLLRAIVRPTRKLAAAARAIGAGELSTRTGVRGRDEIGDLGRAFDGMSDRLEAALGALNQMNVELEAKVAARTGELAAANVKLEAELAARAATETQLLASRERIHDFADSASDWFFETDRHLRLTTVTEGLSKVTGMAASNHLGKTIWELAGADIEQDAAWRRHVDVLSAHRPYRDFECTWRGGGDRLHHVQWNGKPLFDGTGAFAGYRGTGRDVTDLREQEARLGEIVDGLAEGILVFNIDGTIESGNPAAGHMFGVEVNRLVGRYLQEFVPELEQRPVHGMGHSGESGVPELAPGQVFETTGRRADNSNFPLELSVVSSSIAGGHKLIGTLRDITERKEAERIRQQLIEQTYHAQKVDALGNLAAGIAHDFNNALLPIVGMIDLTLRKLPADSAEARNLGKALKSALHARDLVRQILTFGRHEPPERRLVNLDQVVGEAVEFLRATLPTTIRVTATLGKPPCIALADQTQIYQVIVNLGLNASEAMEEHGGELSIDLSGCEIGADIEPPNIGLEPGPYCRLTMTDTGRGMDAQTRMRIFEPFFTTKKSGTSGLGLSVAHGIVRGHGGTISVESQPGRGTRVTVLLPRPAASETMPGPGTADVSADATTRDRRA